MAIQDTAALDVASRTLPARYIYNLASGPAVSTLTLDIVSRALPAVYIYTSGTPPVEAQKYGPLVAQM